MVIHQKAQKSHRTVRSYLAHSTTMENQLGKAEATYSRGDVPRHKCIISFQGHHHSKTNRINQNLTPNK